MYQHCAIDAKSSANIQAHCIRSDRSNVLSLYSACQACASYYGMYMHQGRHDNGKWQLTPSIIIASSVVSPCSSGEPPYPTVSWHCSSSQLAQPCKLWHGLLYIPTDIHVLCPDERQSRAC